ncbi:restriction endonuclease subunit S [Fimbriiglobus ruber]|uniref:Type I restriction-modification system, specificity subunit S n=1 Tax=Fimbriiglobus ruber TaxID=1908690 RepID=A0A225D731_9BACT|nr:restriction endonuclease subunit S [Fimbriiglobus ruber]OWK37400.1 Type I restriction-modification system, specificity subunit S [Fimbriiglobus ruber]
MVPLSTIISELESGVSVNSEDVPAGDSERGVLKVSCVSDGHFYAQENKRVIPSELHRLICSVRRGDLLVTRANTFDLIGASGLVDRDYPNLFLPDKVWRVVLKEGGGDSINWLKHVLNSPQVRAELKKRATGTSGSMKNIPQSSFLAINVFRPPVDEQVWIACVLDVWDRGVRQLTDLISAKLCFKQGLMQHLLTGQRRFQGHVKKKGVQASPAGTIPVDWTLGRLSDVTEEVRRRNDTGVTRVLTASGNHGLIDQQDYFNRSVAGKSLESYFLLKRGEFAYNRSLMKGYPYGATKRLEDYEEGVVSTLYLCFRITSPECNSNWLTHVFEAGVLNSQLRGIAKMGARAHGLLNVAASEFFNMVLPVPSPEEQAAISRVLDAADSEIALLEKELEALKQQKKGLMQKLLTGQVRVPLSKGVA